MYAVSLEADSSIRDVFAVGGYVDPDVQTYPITEAEFETIRASGNHGFFRYENGKVVSNEEAISAQAAAEARAKRKALLLASDWTQLPDAQAGMPEEERAAWVAYRQALRDVPQQAGFPDSIQWPEVP